jgi:hypothetical protein
LAKLKPAIESSTTKPTSTTQAATRPATLPATQSAALPATLPAASQAAAPLLVTTDGVQYFGGNTSLTRVDAKGKLDWPLPPQAQGSVARPWLVVDHEGRLFLFNEPGRLLRLRATPGAPEPFKLEATFSHKIPNVEPLRMWLDPAGRIVFAVDEHQLILCFPGGTIPGAIADKMPAGERDEED